MSFLAHPDHESEMATWSHEIVNILKDYRGETSKTEITTDPSQCCGQLVFVDERFPQLKKVLQNFDRSGRALFLIVEETMVDSSKLPKLLSEELVDDILVRPFRPLEVLSKMRTYAQILQWDEIKTLNASFSQMIERLHDNLKLAERLQKSKMPERYTGIKGLDVYSRYLAGMKSGGDFFDCAESRDGGRFACVLTDASNYGLSNAVLTVLMRTSMKLAAEQARSSFETVRAIFDELLLTLGEKDELGVFYGLLSRKDLTFNFVNFGSNVLCHQSAKKIDFYWPTAKAARMGSGLPVGEEEVIQLVPGDRLVLLSDGFLEGGRAFEKQLEKSLDREPKDLLNELVYQVKSKFQEPDDLPEQDCTALILDVKAQMYALGGFENKRSKKSDKQ